MEELQREIRFLKGVGEKRAALYHTLGVDTVDDLLHHLPRDYTDLSHVWEIAGAPLGELCAVRATVLRKSGEQRIRKGLSLFKVLVTDESGEMLLTFFNARFAVEALRVEQTYLFYGKMEGTLTHRQMSAPAIYPSDQDAQFVPVYPLTQGLSSRMIAANVRQALALLPETPEDPIPDAIRARYHLCHLGFALRNIHFPQDLQAAQQARRRFAFEELLTLSLALSSMKTRRRTGTGCTMCPVDLTPFYAGLPFTPTGAQRRAIEDVCGDLSASVPMNRLVEGDVGSGKTLVAAAACYVAHQNGFQCVMMAPTGILAEQHCATLRGLLGPFGIQVGLLTGSMKASERKKVQAQLATGELTVCVGTHALLSEGVTFGKVGCVITDEQHRFGVEQRLHLQQKGSDPHVLVMSATPIPRTLALIIYGDLDVSIIDELPPGRRPVETYRIDSSRRARAFRFIQKHLDRGLQAYIVCPLVEAGEENAAGLKDATAYAEQLQEEFFRDYRVGLLHGRLKAAQKEEIMRQFKAGELQLLIATTVIEVGVDVPNAVIMMIENAERFGLSQLHQLRGRVGRGSEQSTCILLTDSRNERTLERIDVMCRTGDGFQVAEQDLRLRGPGDFFGQRQHGLPAMRIADLSDDLELLRCAQQAARALLRRDPSLARWPLLAAQVRRMTQAVGERPN